jgi:propanediol utilization protein
VRVGSAHKLEMHLDTDEANALGLASGDKVELVYRRSR